MNHGTYIFGFPDGKPDFLRAIEKESELFEVFLGKILTQDQLRKREQIQYLEKAIQIVIDELLENAKT